MRFKTAAVATTVFLSLLAPAAAQMTPHGAWNGFYAGLQLNRS